MSNSLERRISSLETLVNRVALRQVNGETATRFWTMTIYGDNTIYNSGGFTLQGIDYDGATSATTVPQENPATYVGAMPTGVGRAVLSSSSATVWVALRPNPGTGVITDLLSDVPTGVLVLSRYITTLPVFGSPTVTVPVYIPWLF